jgi:glycosyltransferase involved in cell wall biosynthesis
MPPKKSTAKTTTAAVPAANAALPFVSVLTPTYNRRKFIPLAIQMFKAQTYPQDRMEWIILDDGTDKVGDIFAASGLKNVRYYPSDTKLPIGGKRNRINELARGDICVAWDDDDYYPPDRVKNAVRKLRSVPNRRVPVTGASQMYLYYADRNEIWNIGPYNPNHCTNGTMAYWRSYFKDHRYEDTAEKAEERVFMDNWKTSVIQQTPEETMLVICHSKNTFDKRVLLEKSNPTMKKLSIKLRNFVRDKKIADFYLALKDDFKDDVTAAAAAVTPVYSEKDLNPALEFVDTAMTMEMPSAPQLSATEVATPMPLEVAIPAPPVPALVVEEIAAPPVSHPSLTLSDPAVEVPVLSTLPTTSE